MNLAVAIILFLMTVFAMYAILRLARRSRRAPKTTPSHTGEKEPEQQQQPEKKKKEKWGVEKDAYCYPSINDVMGYEFVKVIKTGETAQTIEDQPAETEPKKTWEESQGIGGLRTVSSTDATSESEEDVFYPDPMDAPRPRPRIPNIVEPEEKEPTEQETPHTDNPEDYYDEDVTEISGVTQEDLELASEIFKDSIPYIDDMPDEQIDQLIEENPQMIEEPVVDEEKAEMAKTVRNLAEAYFQSEKESLVDEVKQLMEDNDE